MEFRLPSNLQTELIAYDPALKALARQTKATSTKAKPKYPLGKPDDLIPTDIIRQSMLDDAIENINANPVNTRFQLFKQLKQVTDDNGNMRVKSVAHAIIYHYENCWYAAWLPPKGKEDEYIYGYAVAYKDTATAWKSIPYSVKQTKDKYTQVTYGRSVFYTYKQNVTKQDIINGCDGHNWKIPGVANYYEKCRELAPALKEFEDALKTTVPMWEDSRGIFDRIKGSTYESLLFGNYVYSHDSYWNTTNKVTWKPSTDSIIKLIAHHAHVSDYPSSSTGRYNKILHIIDKPFFRKWIQSKCDLCIQKLEDTNNHYIQQIKQPWRLIFTLFDRMLEVNKIWPGCPIDYYQNNIDALLSVTFRTSPRAIDWLGQHMPVASFFNNLTKFYEKEMESSTLQGRAYSSDIGIPVFYWHEWNDTVNMIHNILEKDVELEVPKRWRLTEFHDTVQAEAWKIRNPNESLSQDLFPTPIKVELGSSSWSFFQPFDTHQLAQWGQAVRNCVGNASHYAEGVRKKKHFIVLCMVDGRPQFTVQLEVNHGLMSVKQIAGVANARLTEEQRELYTTAFGKALHLREDQLK